MHDLATAIIIIRSVFFSLTTLISLICVLYYKNICTVVSSKYNNIYNTESSEAKLPAL